jgi:hypothetical protein
MRVTSPRRSHALVGATMRGACYGSGISSIARPTPRETRGTPLSTPALSRARSLAAALPLLALPFAGCSRDEPRHYATPKESAPVGAALPAHASPADRGAPMGMPPAMGGAMPEGLPTPEAPPAGMGVTWALPEKWTQERGSGMRFATIRTAEALEISVVTLGGAAGGELANVNRWRGQLGLAPADEAALAKDRLVVKTQAGPIGVFDLVGQGEPAARMIAGILVVPDANTWFFKLTGDAKALEAAKPAFLRFLEGVRRE